MIAMRGKIMIFRPHSQQGAALIIAVLILLILTVIGIYAVTTSTIDTKISGFHKQGVAAFYSADAGIDRTVAITIFSDITDPDDPDEFSYEHESIDYEGTVDYLTDKLPPEGEGFSPISHKGYGYKIESTGFNLGATSDVHLWCTRIGYNLGGHRIFRD